MAPAEKRPARKTAKPRKAADGKPARRPAPKAAAKPKSGARPQPSPAGDGAVIGPMIDEVRFLDLHRKSSYEVVTRDGWTLVITRFEPIFQPWHQPLFGEPMLLVHGFSQNRHAWTAGEFVKDMLYFGVDLHILELRGHGKSSRELQRQKEAEGVRPLPESWDYGWDFSHYFLYDVPAAIDAVKERTGRDKIAYCGHSMGGMIGYGLASRRDDLLCMATIGAPAQLGAEAAWIRMAALAGGLLPLLQVLLQWGGTQAQAVQEIVEGMGLPRRWWPFRSGTGLRTDVLPMDWLLGTLYRSIALAHEAIPGWLPKDVRLFNPTRVALEDVRWLLKEGGEREPLRVLQTFLRWIRHREMVCYQSGYDFQANFHRIAVPLTIIFGDEDVLAGMKSTRMIYENARSDYLVWRPVRGNSHIEITMGYDVRQICYDIKNMIEFALTHQDRRPRLPRRPGHRRSLLRGVRRGRRRRTRSSDDS